MSKFIDYTCSQKAKVKSNADKTHSGQLRVWLCDSGTNEDLEENWIWVRCGTQMYGQTPVGSKTATSSAKDSPKAYGTMFVPQPGAYVKVDFMNGRANEGFWTCCLVHDVGQTKGLPGSPGTPEQHPYSQSFSTDSKGRATDPDFKAQQTKSGVGNDPTLGEGSASMHRDEAPVVYGMTTPGGTQVIMDDKEGSAMYRIRLKSGCQFLMSETDGRVYLGTGDGNSWVSMTKEGNIDLYSSLSVNIRAEQNLNLTTDQDIQIKCKNFNLTSEVNSNIRSGAATNIMANTAMSIGGVSEFSAWSTAGTSTLSAGSVINLAAPGGVKSSDITGKITTCDIAGAMGTPASANPPARVTEAKPVTPKRAPTHEPSATHNHKGDNY